MSLETFRFIQLALPLFIFGVGIGYGSFVVLEFVRDILRVGRRRPHA